MFNLNSLLALGLPAGPELIIIAGILVLLFGAKKIPDLMKGIGQGVSQLNVGLRQGKIQAERAIDEMQAQADADERTAAVAKREREMEAKEVKMKAEAAELPEEKKPVQKRKPAAKKKTTRRKTTSKS